MTTTDRLSDLNSRREITDRFGETVVLGNSVVSGAADMQAAFTMVPRGESEVTATMSVVATANLEMFNGSFGLWSVDFDMNPAATMTWGGNGFYSGAFDSDAAAGAVIAAGAAVSVATFDMDAESAMTGVAGFIIQGASTATLTWQGFGGSEAVFDLNATATLTMGGVGLYPAAFDADAVADLKMLTQADGALDLEAVSSVTFGGESDATSQFDMDAAFTANPVFDEIWQIEAVADLSWASESYAAGGLLANASATPAFATAVIVGGSVDSDAAASVVAAGSTINSSELATIGVGKGYIAGGFTILNDNTGEIDALLFSDDTVAAISATIAARRTLAGISSPTIGYFGGGFISSNTNFIDGLAFASETSFDLTATLNVARRLLAGVQSSTNGYFGGGLTTVNVGEIDGLQFSDESALNPSATLSAARRGAGSASSTSKGYFAGGFTTTDEIDGIQFSDETAINPSVALVLARYELAGLNSTSKGYFGGGHDPGVGKSAEIDGIQFSDESSVNPSAALSAARSTLNCANSLTDGYFVGGFNAASSATDEIDGIQFSDETATNPSSVLSIERYGAGTASSVVVSANTTTATLTAEGMASLVNTKGYICGGFGTAVTAEIDGIQFSDESAINPAAALTVARYLMAGVQPL